MRGLFGRPEAGRVLIASDGAEVIGIAILTFQWTVEHGDLAQQRPPQRWRAGDPAVADRLERILALYVTANTLVQHNRLWSWQEFGDGL